MNYICFSLLILGFIFPSSFLYKVISENGSAPTFEFLIYLYGFVGMVFIIISFADIVFYIDARFMVVFRKIKDCVCYLLISCCFGLIITVTNEIIHNNKDSKLTISLVYCGLLLVIYSAYSLIKVRGVRDSDKKIVNK